MIDAPAPEPVDPGPRAGAVGGLLLLALYLVGWAAVLVLVTVLTVLVLVAGLGIEAALGGGDALSALEQVVRQGENGEVSVPTWVFAVVLAFQLPLMMGLAPLVQWMAEAVYFRPRGQTARPEGWQGVFATYATHAGFYVLALVAGLCVGLLPGWIATQLREAFPAFQEGTLDQINEALRSGHPVWRALFAFEVVIGAAVVEELVFRGFFWDAFRRFASLPVTWVATSAIFAVYHMDPVQSTAVLFTGLALGWMRWASGSVWPSVVMHAANNGLGVAAALIVTDQDVEPSLGVALVGATITVALGAAAAALRVRRGGTLGNDRPPGA